MEYTFTTDPGPFEKLGSIKSFREITGFSSVMEYDLIGTLSEAAEKCINIKMFTEAAIILEALNRINK